MNNNGQKKTPTKSELKAEAVVREEHRTSEKKVINRIVYWIIGILVLLIAVGGFLGYRYFKTSLEPLNPDSKQEIKVDIPIGSSNKEIASILEKNKVIKSGMIFNYYVKTHNYSSFQAGNYHFKASMTLDHIITLLQKGGTEDQPVVKSKVLVKEGVTIDEIGDAIQTATKKTAKFKKADFIKLMKNENYLKTLYTKYPKLLNSTKTAKNVRYHLEGYLYPATYNVYEKMTLKELVTSMVTQMDTELKPLYSQITTADMTVQEFLTLASLVEREGVSQSDRETIAGVFFNRFDADMPLQSDISVMYALNTHKEQLTIADTKVASPYNLYINKGYGPGPFNSPSLKSMTSVLKPKDRDKDYLYFVADLKTGKVYFSKTFEEHTNTDNSISK